MIETTTRGHNGKNADRVEVIWFNRPYQKALGTGRVPIRLSAESYKRHEEAHLFRHHKTKAATSSPRRRFPGAANEGAPEQDIQPRPYCLHSTAIGGTIKEAYLLPHN